LNRARSGETAGPFNRRPAQTRAGPHCRPVAAAISHTLHVIMQEGAMQDDRERFSMAAAITAVLTLGCTIGVLYLPLFLR
jgi:hypothetical protein